MALYAIGDVQGCNDELGKLLDAVKFKPDRDRLWLVGDLVNRGPDSLGVLRRVRALGEAAAVTLGNHDLHLLAVHFGHAHLRDDDTLAQILSARDRRELLEWLAQRAILHEDPELGMCLLHAGLAPQWDLGQARRCARECEDALRRDPERFFARLYGDEPSLWEEGLEREERLRFIVNCFTRLRYVDEDGRLVLRAKGSPKKPQSKPLIPWFEAPGARWHGTRIVFGHWSTLGFFRNDAVVGLDTGCVWGGALTALRLDVPDAKPVQVGCRAHSPIG
ncbi:MAG TPA: symmetrical bis(5'-nucleosyl)-tetraphosphatase [Steroidobacteraceae bacterium]|jgi:bis(5'-nucleosyl)-tetraphosphatase (symmetrical)|nr:symmetrical bis(5'-nucleosyl)-tetraphosphatase [Steroidobacteraceae bacterium]